MDIVAYPHKTYWLGYLFAAPLGGVVFSSVLILPFLGPNPGPEKVGSIILLMTVAIALVGVMRDFRRMYWRLSYDRLVCGRLQPRITIHLAQIQTIFFGLPAKQPAALTAVLFLKPAAKTAMNQMRENTLVLRMNDGTLFPLNIWSLKNGDLIVQQLLAQFKDRVREPRSFSAEEQERLKLVTFNERFY